MDVIKVLEAPIEKAKAALPNVDRRLKEEFPKDKIGAMDTQQCKRFVDIVATEIENTETGFCTPLVLVVVVAVVVVAIIALLLCVCCCCCCKGSQRHGGSRHVDWSSSGEQ